jgi:membrane protease YdiL (CAAX protease family)
MRWDDREGICHKPLKLSMKTYLHQIGRFLLLLLTIQIVRALIITGLWRLLHPMPDSPLWASMEIIAFGLIGIGLLLWFRPSREQLGLDWKSAPRGELAAYLGTGSLTLGLVIGIYFLQPDLFIGNINSAIVIPIFEEFLFRGWGWNQLERSASFKAAGFANWLVISLVFGLWHFGYMDIYLLKMAPANPNLDWGVFFLMKFLTTFVIGLIVGLPRWRTRRVYGSLILHSLINIFGR